jgi:hypothetical protein
VTSRSRRALTTTPADVPTSKVAMYFAAYAAPHFKPYADTAVAVA